LLEEKDLVEAATMASAAAALNVKVLGPMEGDISKETIERLIQEKRLSLRKIKK
jgi:sugar/nucleoside kinase (ribokinase family)